MYLPLSAPARSRSTVSEREFKKLKDDVRANEKKVKSSKTSWAPCKTWLWLWPAIPPGCARNSSLYSSRPDKSSRALFCNLRATMAKSRRIRAAEQIAGRRSRSGSTKCWFDRWSWPVKSFPLLQKSQRPLISSDYCVGSLGNSLRPPGDARSWVLVFSFTASAAGRELRGSLALAGVFSRNGDGAWPDLGFKMGVPRPSKYVQRVCEVANLPPKGKGKKS